MKKTNAILMQQVITRQWCIRQCTAFKPDQNVVQYSVRGLKSLVILLVSPRIASQPSGRSLAYSPHDLFFHAHFFLKSLQLIRNVQIADQTACISTLFRVSYDSRIYIGEKDPKKNSSD